MIPDYYTRTNPMPAPKDGFTTEEAMRIARRLGINFNNEKFNLEQFRMGLDVELEHGRRSPGTNVTGDNPILTGKIALAHLREFPDYYTRLKKLEEEAKAYWSTRNSRCFRNVGKESAPDQWITYITPLVDEAMKEVKEGINLEHLFQEYILSGVLVGMGCSPEQAIQQVEAWEKSGESKLLVQSKMQK